MQIPINFKPRWYQLEALRALESGVKFAVWCWSRRHGKDFTAFGYAVKEMVKQPMNVVLVFPIKEQGRDAFWDNVENDGFKTIEHIPKELILRQDNTDMKIVLKNGSTFQILGATQPDKLRGANGRLYIFSEMVDIPKAAVDVIRPIVRNNGGQIIVQSTPKIDGISGATFQQWFEKAERTPNQFASRITAVDAGYMSAEELEEIRQEAIEENGNDFFFKQEYLCDWGQVSSTSYYGHVLYRLEQRKGVGKYPYNKNYPVYTVWDWGMSDNTAIGFFQYYKVNGVAQLRIIDAYETHDIGIKQLVAYIKTKGYNYAWHFFPHDIKTRDSDTIERIEKFRDEGLINSSVLRREAITDGITRVVEQIIDAVFNEPTTVILRRKLKLYKRKFNPLTGDYVGPQHDTTSHYADMIRYMFIAIEQEFNQETAEMYLLGGSQSEYEADDAFQTSFYEPDYA